MPMNSFNYTVVLKKIFINPNWPLKCYERRQDISYPDSIGRTNCGTFYYHLKFILPKGF